MQGDTFAEIEYWMNKKGNWVASAEEADQVHISSSKIGALKKAVEDIKENDQE